MTGSGRPDEELRRIRNLQSVARHHAAGRPGGEAAPERPDKGGPRWKRRLATLGPLGLAALFLLGKGKLLLPLLKFTKLGTLLTMLLAVWVYAQFWGLSFALGFVLLIFVHEMGHALVMWQQGIRAGAPVFIPFVGAVIAMKSLPRDAWVEAWVGLGGPLLGSAGALVCLGIGWATGSLFWYALASTGFLINLFNLIPVHPLDGGRIVGVINRWLWAAGYAVGLVVLYATRSPILFLILVLGLFSLGSVIRGPRRGYYEIEPRKRLVMGVAYFGLLALLVLGMRTADRPLERLHDDGAAAAAFTGVVSR